MLPVNDIFVCFWLDLNNQQLLITDAAFVHLTSMLLQHIVEIPTMETSVDFVLLLSFFPLFLFLLCSPILLFVIKFFIRIILFIFFILVMLL